MSAHTPSGQQGLSTKLSPREILQECMESAVRLAFIRHDLEIDSDLEITQQEVANDAACACLGERTEIEKPIEEVAIALNRLEAFGDMLSALKACLNMVSGDGLPPNWDFVREAIAKAEKQP